MHDLLMPADAGPFTSVPGGDDAITMCQVPRGRDEVVREILAAAAAAGIEVTPVLSPSGNAVRLSFEHEGQRWMVRLTGDDTRTAIIVTQE